MRFITILIAAFLLCSVERAAAQPIHLTPVHRPDSSGDVLLTIRRDTGATDTSTLKDAILKVDDGRLYIIKPNVTTYEELGSRTIRELIRDLRVEHPAVAFSSRHPERHASEIEDGIYEFAPDTSLPSKDVVRMLSSQGRPHVAVSGGITFVANEVRPASGTTTLMQNAGLALDVVASKPFDLFTLRARVGFHSAEPVAAESNSTPAAGEPVPDDPPASAPSAPDPRSIVETAQAVIAGLNIDIPWFRKRTPDPNRVHLSLGLDWTQHWANPSQSFRLPDSIPLGLGHQPLTEVFSASEIARTQNHLDRVVPLHTVLVGPRILFGSGEHYTFYLIPEYGARQYPRRVLVISYDTDPNDPTARTPSRLGSLAEGEWEAIYRLALGIRLAEGVDFRLDIVQPTGDRNPAFGPVDRSPLRRDRAPAILRIMVGTPGLKFGD